LVEWIKNTHIRGTKVLWEASLLLRPMTPPFDIFHYVIIGMGSKGNDEFPLF
jgi:hypothetical protein